MKTTIHKIWDTLYRIRVGIGHASPEAAEGGAIGLVEEGDTIEIDIPNRTIHLVITDEEMAARPELIKTMSVKPPSGAGSVRLLAIPGIDLQPCGGTHVANISEIGGIKVTKIRSEGRQNKRVEIVLV